MVCCIRSPGQRTATVFPYTTLFRSGRRARSERADHIISGLLTWTLAVTTLMALLVIALAEPLAQLLLAVEDDAASGAPLGAALLRIFALPMPMSGISFVLSASLSSTT